MSKIEVDKVDPQSGTTLTLGTSGDTVSIPSGVTLANAGTATGFGDNLEWQSSIVTAATITVVANRGYWLDTSSNAITVTLPGTAAVGDRLIFTDYARNWGTNAVTINQNSLKFQGNTSPNPVYDTNGESVDIVYSGATKGWIPNTDGAVAFETQQTYTANFLVIAGGGGGGYDRGGGGGAGGYRNSFNSETSGGNSSAETGLQLTPGEQYTVTVGDGGSGASSASSKGTPGVNSSVSGTGITTITSAGGGGAGTGQPGKREGLAGGSGGGSGYNSPASPSGGAGTSGQGLAGADYPGGTKAGGGGGAGQAGNGDTGGNGLASTITGSSVTRGGGGGGHNGGASAPPGGSGGGGAGGRDGSSGAVAGTANTGGGGGGGEGGTPSNVGGAGGKGVIILRVATSDYSGTTTGSPTVSTSGSDTIMVFNSSGSYTA